MKICIVATPCISVKKDLEYGGLEKVVALLAEELGKNNEVYLFAAKGSKVDNCEVIETIEPGYSTITENREVIMIRKIKEDLVKLNADIYDFHVHDPRIIPTELMDESFFSCHDLLPPLPLLPVRTIVRSNFHREYLERKWSWPVDYFCYNPIDVDEYIYSEEKDGFILFLSRMTRGKGIFNLIEIAKAFPEEQFICAGEDGEERGINQIELSEFLSKLPNNVEYLGSVSDGKKKELLSKANLLLLPYDNSVYQEVFGLVILEALASGTPVFAINCGAVKEILGTKFGCVCSNIDELKVKIENYLNGFFDFNPELLRNRAKEFSPSRIVKKLVDIYQKGD